MKKLISAALAASMTCVALTGCSSSTASSAAASTAASAAASSKAEATAEVTGKVTTGGSTSMEKVIGALQEAFMEQNPGVDVTYDPTG